jgi:hypothetical protein
MILASSWSVAIVGLGFHLLKSLIRILGNGNQDQVKIIKILPILALVIDNKIQLLQIVKLKKTDSNTTSVRIVLISALTANH